MKQFEIEKTTEILLYGAATMGTLYGRKLLKEGFNVVGFLDKRADEITSLIDLPVYSVRNDIIDKENVVVLLAVKNVFEHSRIAVFLRNEGYRKIIYRPYRAISGDGNEKLNRINNVYSLITEQINEAINKISGIPLIDNKEERSKRDCAMIKQTGDEIVFYLPISMLFTDKKENVKDISILGLKPHINFVKYLLGFDGGEVNSYIKFCENAALKINEVKITSAWKDNVVRNRAEVFFDMMNKADIWPDFFVVNAPYVSWNEKRHCFNLHSGKHRMAYLVASGRNYVAVKTNFVDYNIYLNDLIIDEKELDMIEEGYHSPIENPFLYNQSKYSDCVWFNILRCVMIIVNNKYYDDASSTLFTDLSYYIDIKDDGFLVRFFERMGGRRVLNLENKIIDIAIIDSDDIHNKIIMAKEVKNIFVLSENKRESENWKLVLDNYIGGKKVYLYYCNEE